MSLPESPDSTGGQVVQSCRMRDVLAMYPNVREDHVRYLEKWGLLQRVTKNGDGRDRVFTFADIAILRQVSAEMYRGVTFRAAVKTMAAGRDGQMAFDFRSEGQPARIVELKKVKTAEQVVVESEVVVDHGNAETFFRIASELDDGNPANHEAAASAYRKALGADPYLVPALINLGNMHYARDELVEAQALYERALALAPDVYEAHFNLGNVLHDLGRLRAASEYYAEAVRLNPAYADAHFYLAVTLEKMGRSQEAKPHWQEYQRLAPDGEWIDLAREFAADPQ